jgi:hypothetical protein
VGARTKKIIFVGPGRIHTPAREEIRLFAKAFLAVTPHFLIYSCATLIGTPCVLPLEGTIIWKVPLTEKALFYIINVPAKTSVRPKPGPVIWKVPISKVPITVVRLYRHFFSLCLPPFLVPLSIFFARKFCLLESLFLDKHSNQIDL